MRIGAHVSTAGGVANAPKNAAALGCETFQFFSRSPQGGSAPALTEESLAAFFAACEENALADWVIHAPYYINFASPEDRTRKNSTRIIREELERASLLKAKYVMFHPGSAKDSGRDEGIAFCIEGIKRVLDGYIGSAKLLIEISAGAGEVIGDRFEEVAALLAGVNHSDVGVCFDTAHAFASGYDLRDAEHVREVMRNLDKTIGLDRLKMSHCNDSKVELGARKDRHEHIGDGFIGMSGFTALCHDPDFSKLPLMILETEPDKVAEDLKTLKLLRLK